MSNSLAEIFLATLVAICHVFAAVLYALGRPLRALPAAWDLQFYALAILSLAFQSFAALSKAETGRKIAAIIAFGCYLLAIYPLPATSGVKITLGIPLEMIIVATFPLAEALFVGSVLVALALAFEGDATVFGIHKDGARPDEYVLLGFVLVFAFLAGLALTLFGESRRRALREAKRLNEAIDRIAEVNAGFQSALAMAEEESTLLERNRITREIHDIVGYAFTNQQMMIEAALMLVDRGNARLVELLAMARDAVAEGLRETRKTLYELRRTDEPRNPGLGVFIKVARNFETVTGVRVNLDFGNAQGLLAQGSWLTVYRLIQESMINAFRHGKARSISITFREDRLNLHIMVRDDGRGSSSLAEGIGLSGMRERIGALGGQLEAGNSEDGFVVRARIPLQVKE
ncbi:MAG: histidine kinase [Treponema sp.]|nr:histidine kinase [Treponema sp.]